AGNWPLTGVGQSVGSLLAGQGGVRIPAPLGHVPVHVEQPPDVGKLSSSGPRMPFRAEVKIAVTGKFLDGVAEGIGRRGSSPAGELPFGGGGQRVAVGLEIPGPCRAVRLVPRVKVARSTAFHMTQSVTAPH